MKKIFLFLPLVLFVQASVAQHYLLEDYKRKLKEDGKIGAMGIKTQNPIIEKYWNY